jgi:hypothetical protein
LPSAAAGNVRQRQRADWIAGARPCAARPAVRRPRLRH